MQDWGLIEYSLALEKQRALVEDVRTGASHHLIFCSHPEVVTLGRATQVGDVEQGCPFDVVEVERGGRATYHGPEQLVIYPIFHLDRISKSSEARPRDVVQFLRACETITVAIVNQVFQEAGISKAAGTRTGATGVWVEDERKIASIGIAVKRWVSLHGIALNLDVNKNAFRGINPCGYSARAMTSVEREIGQRVDRAEVQKLAVEYFSRLADLYR